MDEAKKHAEIAITYNTTGKFDGAHYVPICTYKNDVFYLYTFSNSVPASAATIRHFTALIEQVDSDSILPQNPGTNLYIDFKLTTVTAANQASASTSKATVEAICGIIVSQEVLDPDPHVLVDIIKSKNPMQYQCTSVEPLISMDESAYNRILFQQIGAKANEMGFEVSMNTDLVPGLTNSLASKYYKSRPDIVMYMKDLVYVVMSTSNETSEESTDETTLEGAVTENKKSVGGDIRGQLLAGMEKVAGDLAFKHIRDAAIPEEKRVFRHITINGLVIDFGMLTCTPYKLNMDFVERGSKLDEGTALPLIEGINRLIAWLLRNRD